jgi:hypothetical protein
VNATLENTGWQLSSIVIVQIMELGKLLGISWWLSEKTSVSNRVSCDPKSLTVKGDLMVVKVFSVMEKARRRRSGRICQLNRKRQTLRLGYLCANEGSK